MAGVAETEAECTVECAPQRPGLGGASLLACGSPFGVCVLIGAQTPVHEK